MALFVPRPRIPSGGHAPAPDRDPFKSTNVRKTEMANISALSQAQGIPISAPTAKDYPASLSRTIDLTSSPERDPLPAMTKHDYLDQSEKELLEIIQSMPDMDKINVEESSVDGLLVPLLPHQVKGLHWLKDRESGKGNKFGGILADDMGLGKTIQMISLMLEHRPEGKPRGTLIVVPLALMDQWENEIQVKTEKDSFKVYAYHGPGRTTNPRKLHKYDVVLTTYQTVGSEYTKSFGKTKKKKGKSDEKKGSDDDDVQILETTALFEAKFHRIILDEAHNIKNRTAKMSLGCCALSAKFRWCLTGTPVQNNSEDLYSIFKFLDEIAKPLHDLSEFKRLVLAKKNYALSKSRPLDIVVSAILLRRTKTMLIDGKPLLSLPSRTLEAVKSPFLDVDEQDFYTAIEQKAQLQFNKYLKAGSVMNNYASILTMLLRLRQACLHPALVTKDDPEALSMEATTLAAKEHEGSETPPQQAEIDDLAALLGGLSVKTISCSVCGETVKGTEGQLCSSCADLVALHSASHSSTKIKKVMMLLDKIRKDDPKRKVLIFSQFTSMLNILKPFLKRADFGFVTFDGSMNKAKRDDALHLIRVDADKTVMLISLKCGATGLNLTCCDTVIFIDIWWNPAIQEQAIDRAHRIGQQREVQVYTVTIENSIEDRLLEIQERKRLLAKDALGEGREKVSKKLGLKDMIYLFRGGE